MCSGGRLKLKIRQNKKKKKQDTLLLVGLRLFYKAMLENVVTIAIVIVIANANVKFFNISGWFFFISFLHLHHIVCHCLIRAKMDH